MDSGAERMRAAIDAQVDGRDVVLMAHAVGGLSPLVEAARGHGAGRILVLAAGTGTGERPDDISDVVVATDVRTMTEEVLAIESMVERMSDEHHAALDAWDPGRAALVLANPIGTAAEVGGRPIVGHRRPAWADVEDKATVDELLAAAGVAAPPHEVVGPDEAGAAARRLDRGAGVVVAAGGRNGGGDGVRWVDSSEATDAARHLVGSFVGARGRGLGLVRVAPFVEGTPCSIGAMVTGDGVAVLRPVEQIVLRRGRRLLYSGLSTTYEPPAAVRQEMAAAARRVGEEMRRRVGYRGGFSVDGIVGADGWWATEVNSRLSGGFNTLPVGGEAPHVAFVQAAVVEGVDDATFTARAIEATYGPAAETTRTLRLARVLPRVPDGGPRSAPIVVEDDRARLAADGEEAHGRLLVGDAPAGGVVLCRVTTTDAPLRVGPAAAPLAVSLLDLADELWATGTRGLAPPVPGRAGR